MNASGVQLEHHRRIAGEARGRGSLGVSRNRPMPEKNLNCPPKQRQLVQRRNEKKKSSLAEPLRLGHSSAPNK
ncbi:hypothetical protein HPP92_003939 [Vanilla planifolia]|uniref:Uncharacterized protein n=1 Tax=Vanilla planifolia TaxID=51239 RepID=A0A835S8H6_VANPL|nr:hypothetical protein HPP92_003939 [Vanilla planifolia]